MKNKTKQITQEISIPVIESNKDGYWEHYPDRKIWHSAVKFPTNMPNKNWNFVSPFIRGADLPEGQPVKFEVREDNNGECWGWKESKGKYGCEVIFSEDGTKKLIEFYVNLFDNQGQEKIWSRSSQTFWRQLERDNLKKGDTINIIRIGEEKQARYTFTLDKRAEIEFTEEEKATEIADKKKEQKTKK